MNLQVDWAYQVEPANLIGPARLSLSACWVGCEPWRVPVLAGLAPIDAPVWHVLVYVAVNTGVLSQRRTARMASVLLVTCARISLKGN